MAKGRRKSTFNECLCDKNTLAVLHKFLAAVFFQNYFADKLIRWFVFKAVQKMCIAYFKGSKALIKAIEGL